MGVRRTKQVVADVNRPLMSVAKMVAAGNRVHLDSKDPRIVRPKGEIFFFCGKLVTYSSSITGSGKTQQGGGQVFHRQD